MEKNASAVSPATPAGLMPIFIRVKSDFACGTLRTTGRKLNDRFILMRAEGIIPDSVRSFSFEKWIGVKLDLDERRISE
jgi:hypothetical protein